jgi:hypothetical protein
VTIPPARMVALRDALGAALPDGKETSLLRACLWTGQPGRAAWDAFERDAGDLRELFRADHGSRKRLGPLFAAALRANAVPADPALLTVLRTAQLREELRAELYSGIRGEVLAAFGALEIRFLVLKGAAFGTTLYEGPALRHSHDIDLLVPAEDSDRAAAALVSRGFALTGPGRLEHSRALPVNLHGRLLPPQDAAFSFEEVWARSREARFGDRSARILGPADALLHVLGVAARSPARRSLQWACDAWLLIARMDDGDWAVFRDGVTTSRLALWCWPMLEYLAGDLGARVPLPVRAALLERAAGVDALDRDRALHAARADSGTSGFAQVRLGSTALTRARIFLWFLFPCPAYLRQGFAGDPPGVPALYGGRMFRYLKAAFRRMAPESGR